MKSRFVAFLSVVLLSIPAFADIAKDAENPICNGNTIGATSGSTALDAAWNANTLNLKWYADGDQYASNTCIYGGNVSLPNGTPTKTGYTFAGWALRPAVTLSSVSLNTNGTALSCKSYNGLYSTGDNVANLNNSELEVVFDYGTVHGMSYCSAKSVQNTMDANSEYILTSWGNGYSDDWVSTLSEINSVSGNKVHCWCNLTGFTPTNGSRQNLTTSRVIYDSSYEESSQCESFCMASCATHLKDVANFRTVFYNNNAQ